MKYGEMLNIRKRVLEEEPLVLLHESGEIVIAKALMLDSRGYVTYYLEGISSYYTPLRTRRLIPYNFHFIGFL